MEYNSINSQYLKAGEVRLEPDEVGEVEIPACTKIEAHRSVIGLHV